MKKSGVFFTAIFAFELLVGCTPTQEKYFYISTGSAQTTFNVGEAFNHDGLVVSDLSTFIDITDYQLSIDDGYVFTTSDVGSQLVKVSKSGYKSNYYEIEVTNYHSLTIESYPKQNYVVGERFDLAGILVYDGSEYITDFESSIKQNYKFLETGTFEVEISKVGFVSAYFSVTVVPASQLFVSTNPTKVTYAQGEAFSSSGLAIVDEHNNPVNGFTVSIKDGDILKYHGPITVKVEKEGYLGCDFDITVTQASPTVLKEKQLNIYYINDTHGSFIRQTVPNSTSEGGMAYIGQYIIDKVNDDHSHGIETIVLSGGDMFQGGLESNETRGAIMVDAMNEIGFDAMVLGNHEFDWGEYYIEQFASTLNCPIISCNTLYVNNLNRPNYLSPYVILDKNDLRVGIIGCAEANMGSHITGSISNNFTFPDPVSYVKDYSNELRLSYNCDVVIAAFHDAGFEGYEGEPEKFSALTDINQTTTRQYVDAMFFAHDHYRKYGVYNDVAFLESGCNGRYVGKMSLSLDNTYVMYSVTGSSMSNVSAYNNCLTANAVIANLPTKYAEQIGDPDEVLYTFTQAYSSDDFTVVACHAMYWYVNSHLSEFDNRRVYMASHNLGGIRSNIAKGDFTRRDLVKVFPFDNELCLQLCTQQQIERTISYSYYETYLEDDPVYINGVTTAVSITYITESQYAFRYQESYVKYQHTAKQALEAFLREKIVNNL